ncbi:hypothetical protein C4561_03705 [candidate division WWE3 bacterium]|jgi:hypothetical protein|uniref:Glycosyltransferase RgtA/B/C/D-like domain-containing protein n=1 Tax=candidate division WWE3 bacterium TaxID=2053526 RepID=A0A3A4ZC68_UNCKA|nr:MAG: hypothetical protein C4561_03705 [candidate division WWE3 bacterium]
MIKKILISLILAMLITKLPFVDINTELLGDGGDSAQFALHMDMAGDNIQEGKYFFTGNTRLHFPYGFDFTRTNDGAFAILLGAVLSMFFPIIVSYNLVILAIVFLNLLLSFIFFEKIRTAIKDDSETPETFLAVISAGIAFALSPFVVARLNGHPSLAFVGGFPALVYWSYALISKITSEEKTNAWDYAKFFTGLMLVSLGSIQYLILLLWVSVIFSTIYVVIYRISVERIFSAVKYFLFSNVVGLLLSFLMFTVVFTAFFKGYVVTFFEENVSLPTFPYTGSVYDLFLPNGYLGKFWRNLNPSTIGIEHIASIGVIELVIFFILFVRIKNRNLRILITIFCVLFSAAGTNVLKIPLYTEPPRSVVLATLLFAVMLLLSDLFKKKTLGFLILSLILLERLTFTVYSTETPYRLGETMQELPGSTVLVIPVTTRDAFRNYILLYTSKSLYDGHMHHMANTTDFYKKLAVSPIARFTCVFEEIYIRDIYKDPASDPEVFWEYMELNDTRVVVVIKDRYPNINMSECVYARQNLEAIISELELVESTQIYDIYLIKKR